MRKIDELLMVLNKIQEQDATVDVISTDPEDPGVSASVDTAIVPLSYDNTFFGQLKAGDVFTDKDDETIKYKVISDPVADQETGMVTSLPCEVVEAPEGNSKGVAVGDQFDAITSMPGKVEPAPEPPVEEPVSKPAEEPAPEPTEAKKDNKPAWMKKVGKHKAAPNQPGKKKGEGYTLKRRFSGIKETFPTTGIVQEVRPDGKVVVRMGKWHKVFDSAAGAKEGDMVEIDGEKITKVISSQDKATFSKVKS